VAPSVARKDELMRDERYQKIAFRETVERFFELFDLGKVEGDALAMVLGMKKASDHQIGSL